jgi:ribosomal protein L7/L12
MKKVVSYEVGFHGMSVLVSHPDIEMLYKMVAAAEPFNKKVATIKMVRQITNWSLKEAKFFVEDAWDLGYINEVAE